MKLLAVKKDRLEDLIKFGFEKDDYDSYIYNGEMDCYEYRIHVMSWCPLLSVSEYATENFEYDKVVSIPDVIMDLIEAGVVERYE